MAERFSAQQVEELAEVCKALPSSGEKEDLQQIVRLLRESTQSAFSPDDIESIALAISLLDVPLEERPFWGGAAPTGQSRGLFFVFEGLDRSGKSTQSRMITKHLEQKGDVKWMCFPNRKTPTGTLIDLYLRRQIELPDKIVHLLFSANRWETATSIVQDLMSGTSIVCDRYAFSGVAYSAAKGLDFSWCREPDRGLPCPDGVFFMRIDEQEGSKRSNFGDERYENASMQAAVRQKFQQPELTMGVNWCQIDGARAVDEIHSEICKMVGDIRAAKQEHFPAPGLETLATILAGDQSTGQAEETASTPVSKPAKGRGRTTSPRSNQVVEKADGAQADESVSTPVATPAKGRGSKRKDLAVEPPECDKENGARQVPRLWLL